MLSLVIFKVGDFGVYDERHKSGLPLFQFDQEYKGHRFVSRKTV